MKYRVKVWAEINGKSLLGPGRYRLLSAIQATGSINAAAKELGIPYRRAWGQVREMERLLGASLVDSSRGGVSGGGTRLTPVAVRLMKQYQKICDETAVAVKGSGAEISE